MGTVRKHTKADGQVGNEVIEKRIGQDGLMNLLESGQMVKECGCHLTGNGESLKDFEQVEQGKDVTCLKGCFQRWSHLLLSAVCRLWWGLRETETGRPAAVIQGRDMIRAQAKAMVTEKMGGFQFQLGAPERDDLTYCFSRLKIP